MLWISAAFLVAGALFAFSIDDWSRDFTTNVASTRSDSEKLKPLNWDKSPEESVEILRRTVAGMPNWQWIDETTSPGGRFVVNLVRSTSWLKFKDDVQVTITPEETASDDVDASGRSTLNVVSRSRIGKGDLGQNPRNIIELLTMLRKSADLKVAGRKTP